MNRFKNNGFNANMSHKQSQSFIANPEAVRIGNEVEALILESMQYQKVGLGGLLPARKGDLIPDYIDGSCIIEIKYSGTNTIYDFNVEQLYKYVNAFNKNHAYFLLVTKSKGLFTSVMIDIKHIQKMIDLDGNDFWYKGNGNFFENHHNEATSIIDQLLNGGEVDFNLGQLIKDELRRIHNEANAK